MNRTRFFSMLSALLCLLSLLQPVGAAEVESGDVYCFSPGDFVQGEELAGICITSIPDSGSLMLGSRVLQAGDILTAEQMGRMTYRSAATDTGCDAALEYLPIFADRVESVAVMSIAVIGKTDQAPVAAMTGLHGFSFIQTQTERFPFLFPDGEHHNVLFPKNLDVKVTDC